MSRFFSDRVKKILVNFSMSFLCISRDEKTKLILFMGSKLSFLCEDI